MHRTDRPPHYLKSWRKHSGFTQSEVIAKLKRTGRGDVPITTASLSRIENGVQPYSQPVVEELAKIYGTTVGRLIDMEPDKLASR